MKILICGHTGLVGTGLMSALKEQGHEVFGASRRNGYDLRDKWIAKELVKKINPEVIYFLSANAAEARGQVSPMDMTERNLNILLNVLVPSINAKIKRFIYTSSVAVYGDVEVPYAEDDIPKPKDVYGVNKWAGEQILKIMAKVHGFEYAIFRPHNIYGPHQDMSNPYKNVVALFMRKLIEDQEITLFGEGKMRRAFSYVDDVVEVLIKGMNDNLRNQTLNVGSCMDIEIAELLSLLERVSGKKAKINYKPARTQEIYNFLASHRKQEMLTKYHETPLIEGLTKTWNHINLPEEVREGNEIE